MSAARVATLPCRDSSSASLACSARVLSWRKGPVVSQNRGWVLAGVCGCGSVRGFVWGVLVVVYNASIATCGLFLALLEEPIQNTLFFFVGWGHGALKWQLSSTGFSRTGRADPLVSEWSGNVYCCFAQMAMIERLHALVFKVM